MHNFAYLCIGGTLQKCEFFWNEILGWLLQKHKNSNDTRNQLYTKLAIIDHIRNQSYKINYHKNQLQHINIT